MHGINTIHKLNELAAQNANAARTLQAAEAKLKAAPSPLSGALEEALAKRNAQREEILEKFRAKTTQELLDYVGALQSPTLLEVVLSEKLLQTTKGA